MQPAVALEGLSHSYGEHRALRDLSLEVAAGQIFGLLGPNGGGKTTLFRILCTLLPVQTGSAQVFAHDVARAPDAVRRLIGVTFQSPSLDGKLTVKENLLHQGRLYGLSGKPLRARIDELLARFGLTDRADDKVESLSGGLKRRTEIAKGLLHSPQLLLLDEPSTGLDPGARLDMWRFLSELRTETGVTILVTTHILDEAERCDRLGLLNAGELVALGSPHELKSSLGGDCITIHAADADALAKAIEEQHQLPVQRTAESLRIETMDGRGTLHKLLADFGERIRHVSLGKPTLEDVFVARTGRALGSKAEARG